MRETKWDLVTSNCYTHKGRERERETHTHTFQLRVQGHRIMSLPLSEVFCSVSTRLKGRMEQKAVREKQEMPFMITHLPIHFHLSRSLEEFPFSCIAFTCIRCPYMKERHTLILMAHEWTCSVSFHQKETFKYNKVHSKPYLWPFSPHYTQV